MDSALAALAALLIAISGLVFIVGGRRSGGGLLLLGVFAAVAGAVTQDSSVAELSRRLGMSPATAEPAIRYALYGVGFLVALNLIRHSLALFVGYPAADSAVGGVLSSLLLSVFAVVFWPVRRLLRVLSWTRWD